MAAALTAAGLVVVLLVATCVASRHDPPSPPTGGFPDSGKECQWAVSTHNTQYHIVNNITEKNGVLTAGHLNDANGVFKYKGLYHVMNQAGGGNWTHAISSDLVQCASPPTTPPL